MNPQPRPDNITAAAITIKTTSRWVLTSSSHSNIQTNTKYRTKVTEYVAGSYLQRLALEDGGWSGRVFCRRVCAAQCSSSDSPLSGPGCSYIYPFRLGNATILDCWVISQSYVRHTGLHPRSLRLCCYTG